MDWLECIDNRHIVSYINMSQIRKIVKYSDSFMIYYIHGDAHTVDDFVSIRFRDEVNILADLQTVSVHNVNVTKFKE